MMVGLKIGDLGLNIIEDLSQGPEDLYPTEEEAQRPRPITILLALGELGVVLQALN